MTLTLHLSTRPLRSLAMAATVRGAWPFATERKLKLLFSLWDNHNDSYSPTYDTGLTDAI